MTKIGWIVLSTATLAACESKTSPPSNPATHLAPPPAMATATLGHAASTPQAPPASSLTVVRERSQVCMVNDQFMGREQIPVTVSGKTYFGCCPMCKGKLEQDPAVRTAKDPVTGRAVDKATAVMAKAPSGNILYFESEATLARYGL